MCPAADESRIVGVEPSASLLGKGSPVTYVLTFALGLLFLSVAQQVGTFFSVCHETYDLLSPRLRCTNTIQQGEWDYEPLREELLAKKAELKDSKKVSHVSIFFRDLDHGPRFGIGEYDKFQPASLLKLPVLIAFLHEADRNPDLLNQTLSFAGTIKTAQNVEVSDETIKPNTPYTIRELLTKMIVYSDNYSYALLTHELNEAPSLTTYYTFRDLDILKMMLAPRADYISIQSYGNLFAVLYNTGYLSKEMSQFALELLSQATFRDGLVAGVPENIRVAHKFGYRTPAGEDSQLHDCGIVYHPSTTYMLCVMTSGSDLESEQSAIAEVSRVVYDRILSLHLGNRGS